MLIYVNFTLVCAFTQVIDRWHSWSNPREDGAWALKSIAMSPTCGHSMWRGVEAFLIGSELIQMIWYAFRDVCSWRRSKHVALSRRKEETRDTVCGCGQRRSIGVHVNHHIQAWAAHN